MRKIITFVLAIAMVMACAVSASAESKINLTGDHAGDKEGPGYAEYEVLGLDYDAGAKINEDGLVVEAGFEVHALQGTAEGKLGSEENNVHGGVTGSLGGGRAGAGISAGLDEKGNVKVGAEVGAEAIGAEVGVEGGVTVGGIEANVGAKGKVGVGAKAKAGFEDGKLKLELELVVGLGGEVDVEIDFSNMTDPFAEGNHLQGLGDEYIQGVIDGKYIQPSGGVAFMDGIPECDDSDVPVDTSMLGQIISNDPACMGC